MGGGGRTAGNPVDSLAAYTTMELERLDPLLSKWRMTAMAILEIAVW